MKKIIVTAKEQWKADLRKCVAENGDIDNNPETYKIVDNGIGIINDNELYHLCGNDNNNHFFLKVGNNYSHVWTSSTPERVLWNNAEKLDFNESWFDKAKVITFLRESNDDDLMDGSPIEFYQLIWMGIWGSETDCHEYEDYEKEVDDEENKKVVEGIVQDLRDALTAQKKVVWSMICNRFEKDKKNIDMKRMPDVIADEQGYQFDIRENGDFFAIVKLDGKVKILFREYGDEKQEADLEWKEMSYEALIDILYAMA